MGRTGKWFGFQHYDIQPDIVSIGKGLGNGYPVSAIAMQREVAWKLEQDGFRYVQSHQNDPLGCSIAREVIAIFRAEGWVEKGDAKGQYFLERLKQLEKKYARARDGTCPGISSTFFSDFRISCIAREGLFGWLLSSGEHSALRPRADDREGRYYTSTGMLGRYAGECKLTAQSTALPRGKIFTQLRSGEIIWNNKLVLSQSKKDWRKCLKVASSWTWSHRNMPRSQRMPVPAR
jgi:hypothetical protein